jgi:uncharacterized protein YegP (UPF0339 family)
MAGKFVIQKDKAGQFRFNLKASNGEVMLSSEGYTTLQGCSNGIESVRTNAPVDARYQRKESASGKYSFNLTAANNQVIGSSEQYTTAAARDKGIESVKKNAPTATVENATEK